MKSIFGIKHLVFKKGKPLRIDIIQLRSLEGTNTFLNAPHAEKKKKGVKIEHAAPASIFRSVIDTHIFVDICGPSEKSSVLDFDG